MSIFVIGINHKTASITLRERVYFAAEKLPLYLQDLLHRGGAEEAVLLSTCNRSELYCEAADVAMAYEWFCAQTTLPANILQSAVYIHRDAAAIAHIMEVACGLDSMVLGEPQILGQMKEAFSESCAVGAIGTLFHRLFQHVFTTAKEIRTTTAIGACPVSVASAAVQFAKQYHARFDKARVLLIGAGETAEILMRYLQSQVATPITLVNRSFEKAAALLEQFGGQVYGLDKLTAALSQADIVFSATGSAVPLVTKAMLAEIRDPERSKPLLLLDLAVPRDIEPAVAELSQIALYCIDDLKTIIQKNRQGREHAAEKAREMTLKRSEDLMAEIKSLDNTAYTIRAYRSQIEKLCRAELNKAKQQLRGGADPAQVLDAFAYAFIKKLLHTPSVQLRQAGVEGRVELLQLARKLFALPDAETDCL